MGHALDMNTLKFMPPIPKDRYALQQALIAWGKAYRGLRLWQGNPLTQAQYTGMTIRHLKVTNGL